jgi:hypothetical protein
VTNTSYCTTEQLRTASNIADTLDDAPLDAAIAAASRRIDSYCGRRFYPDAATSTRLYQPDYDLICVKTDDISTTVGLIVETSIDNTTWRALSTYEIDPNNGIGPNGQGGWPYSRIRLVSNFFYAPWPLARFKTVRITATWGWAAVPDDVSSACLLLAQRIYRSKDVPFGATGYDSGVISAKGNPIVYEMLQPYQRADAFAGIA